MSTSVTIDLSEIDSLISLEQTVEKSYKYIVQTLDYAKHAEYGGQTGYLRCVFSPFTPEDNDALWSLLTADVDYVMVVYPKTSTQWESMTMIVEEVSREELYEENGVTVYGDISVVYKSTGAL